MYAYPMPVAPPSLVYADVMGISHAYIFKYDHTDIVPSLPQRNQQQQARSPEFPSPAAVAAGPSSSGPVSIRIPIIPPFPAPEQWVRPAFLPPTPPPSPPPPEVPPSSKDAAVPLDDAGSQGDGGQAGQAEVAGTATVSSGAPKPVSGAGGAAGDLMDVEEGEDEQRPPSRRAGETGTSSDAVEKDDAQAKDKEAFERQKDQGVEEEKGRDKEESEKDPEAAAARRKEELARKEAQAEAARKKEAAEKAEAERKAVASAEAAAERRVRRLRVSLVLNRLKEEAEDRRRSGRYVPPQRGAAALQHHCAGSSAGEQGSAGQGKGEIITIPCLRDRGDKKEKIKCGDAGGGSGGSSPAESSRGAESPDWPPLGRRRLKRRLDCATRHAESAGQPGGRRGPRLATVLQTEMRSEEVKAASGGSWLEAKLARMRKIEVGEWAAWQQRLEEEGAANPDEAAGPPLPFGFVPRLAHRALGAYALIRAFSRPFRLTPASSVAFLRALSLRLRTPLLDAIHCELLRRVFCLLKGRAGGWAKSTNAQRELDWKYLDQVCLFSTWYVCDCD